MTYFGSAKNRVGWQKELSELKRRRMERETLGYAPDKSGPMAEKRSAGRRPITFSQLEERVLASSRAGKTRPERVPSLGREKSRTQESLLMQGKERRR